MAKAKKTSKITIDRLAVMIQNGFIGVDKRFEEVDKRFDKIEKDINGLKDGQERVELRLTNVAYRFELQELQARVGILEKKAGIKK